MSFHAKCVTCMLVRFIKMSDYFQTTQNEESNMFPHKQILCPTFSFLGSHHLLIHDGYCQENTLFFGIFKRKLPTQDQGQSDSWPNKRNGV